jgi:hypothetical protein
MGDLIEKGRETGVFRSDQGWEDVILLCREVAETGEGPIVTSYSISTSSPAAAQRGGSMTRTSGTRFPTTSVGISRSRACERRSGPSPWVPDRQGQRYLTGESVFDLLATRWTGQLVSCNDGSVGS